MIDAAIGHAASPKSSGPMTSCKSRSSEVKRDAKQRNVWGPVPEVENKRLPSPGMTLPSSTSKNSHFEMSEV